MEKEKQAEVLLKQEELEAMMDAIIEENLPALEELAK